MKGAKGAGDKKWSVTFSLSLMDPFPRIDIFVRVSSCSLFNEFPRGPRSLPTKLNCNRERERGSIRICVFEIKSKAISYVSHTWLYQRLKLMKTCQQFCLSMCPLLRRVITGPLCHLFAGYGFIWHEDALQLTLCLKTLS